MSKAQAADIVISFDATGSMSSCIGQVRREVEKTVKELFDNLPDLRVGIVVHGDYCDNPKLRYQKLDLTTNQKEICRFIKESQNTGGGDSDEFYEYVLEGMRLFNWDDKRSKAVVMIGDAEPHQVGYSYGGQRYTLDWRNELQNLLNKDISVYAVQCLGYYGSKFWQQLADHAGTPKLELNQFGQVNQLLQAICYKQSNRLPEFEALLRAKATERIDFSLLSNLDKLAGKKAVVSKAKRSDGLVPVHPSRFQILKVEGYGKRVPIKNFVTDNGLAFKAGKGFYQFTKSEEVQEKKEVVIQDKRTGDLFSGEIARNMIGLPFGTRGTVRPTNYGQYKIFIQSTSNNRALVEGTDFLYEVADDRR